MRKFCLAFLLVLFLIPSSALAEVEENKIEISLLADQQSIQPGTPFTIGILFQIEKGWHTYYKEPGDAGAPARLEWSLPKGFKVGEIQWPPYQQLIEPGDIRVNAYERELLLWAKVWSPSKIAEKEVRFKVDAKWLVCEKVCIPESGSAELVLPVSLTTPMPNNALLFQKYQEATEPVGVSVNGHLWKFLLFAFIGGIILNAMPCVLPVISLKLLSFVRMAHGDRKRMASLGFAFVAGVLASFAILAFLVIGLKQLGQDLGWGFQFQYPGFVVVMTTLVFLLGLSLAGVFELTLTVPKKGVQIAQEEGLVGAFFYGVLATILATPCTAPFVGATVGFALLSTPINIVSIFLTMGFGLAFPFLLLALNPGWTRFVPKPGPWMELLKQFMAFLLFATAVWLLWVVGRQVGVEGMVWALFFLVCLGLAAWIYGKVQFLSRNRRFVWFGILIVFLFFTGQFFISPIFQLAKPEFGIEEKSEGIPWVKYQPELLAQELAAGNPVFLDFTADWCLTCKVNEITILNKPDVIEAFAVQGITGFKLDWTHQDKEVTKMLKRFGRFGVPLYVYYPKGDQSKPQILPEILTKKRLLNVLKGEK